MSENPIEPGKLTDKMSRERSHALRRRDLACFMGCERSGILTAISIRLAHARVPTEYEAFMEQFDAFQFTSQTPKPLSNVLA